MDGYFYLILQILPIVSVVAIIFFLMGHFFGAAKFRTRLKECEAAREALGDEVTKFREGEASIASDLKVARDQLRQLKGGKAQAQSRDLGQGDAAELAPAQAAARPKPAEAEVPPDLGQIFEVRPELVDDLKQVRGIAKVMEQNLNAIGIYTFAQIARWSDGAAEEFGRRLGIVGTIERYNWRQQCAKLHQEKYHEAP